MIASSFLFVVESRKNSKVKIWRWEKMCMLRCQIWFTQLVKWYMDFKKCMHYSESYIWGNRFTACKNGSLLTLAQFLGGFFAVHPGVVCVCVRHLSRWSKPGSSCPRSHTGGWSGYQLWRRNTASWSECSDPGGRKSDADDCPRYWLQRKEKGCEINRCTQER